MATPSPSARMRGVVTSPVVTPALSHAMPTAVSEAVCKRRGASGVGKRCEASGVGQAAWGKRCGHAAWGKRCEARGVA